MLALAEPGSLAGQPSHSADEEIMTQRSKGTFQGSLSWPAEAMRLNSRSTASPIRISTQLPSWFLVGPSNSPSFCVLLSSSPSTVSPQHLQHTHTHTLTLLLYACAIGVLHQLGRAGKNYEKYMLTAQCLHTEHKHYVNDSLALTAITYAEMQPLGNSWWNSPVFFCPDPPNHCTTQIQLC